MRITIQVDLDGGVPTVSTDIGATPTATHASDTGGTLPRSSPQAPAPPSGTTGSAEGLSAGAARTDGWPPPSVGTEPTAHQLTQTQAVGALDGGPAPASPPADHTSPPAFTAPPPSVAVPAGEVEALADHPVHVDISAGPAPGALGTQDGAIFVEEVDGDDVDGEQESTGQSGDSADDTPVVVQKTPQGKK